MQQHKISSPSFFIGKSADRLISFGSGQPDLPPPPQIFRGINTMKIFTYGLIQGNEDLRQALAKKYPGAGKEHFVITNGASEALDLTLRAIFQPRAKILLPKPYYYSYPHNVRLAGMTPVYYKLERGKINITTFAKIIRGCRAVIINSPSNPTGTVQEISTLKKIEILAKQLGVYIISDEVYKDLIYVRKNYLLKGPHVLTINSFSKTFAMCGLRVGYLYSTDREVVERVIEIKTHTSMNTNVMAQHMARGALRVPQSVINKQTAIWRARRDYIYQGLVDLGLDVWKPEGAFYVFPKFKNPNKVITDLYDKYKIIAYDGTWFGDPTRVRFSYALDLEKITEGLRRLKMYLEKEYRG